jgi:predicted TIM-barrel fold metal-dependent hydrolase
MTDIFDHHQHIGFIADITGDIGTAERRREAEGDALEADYRARVATMDRLGILQASLMPGHSYPRPGGLAHTRAMNDRLAAYRKRDPDRFPAIAGTVEPRYGEAGLEEIDRMHALGFQAISWHHRQQGLPINHPVMHRYAARMADLGMVPFVHTFVGADFEEIWRLRDLALAFPAVRFLCMDSMTDAAAFEEALAAGARTPNLLFDTTSLALGPAAIERFVETLGAERLLFGSNLYSDSPAEQLESLDAVRQANISAPERAAILGGNARRLLGIVSGAKRGRRAG